MSYLITEAQFAQFAPNVQAGTRGTFVEVLNRVMDAYGINASPRRVRYFLSQSFFETMAYTKFVEDLYYTTPARLCQVWPSRFSMTQTSGKCFAPDYVNDAQKLANAVYANQYGNGPESSGDGYKYRGRGAFHLTFKNNYLAYSKARYGDDRCVQTPDMVAQPEDAFFSAGYYWSTRRYQGNTFNQLADSDSFTMMTTAINGSASTVPQRLIVLDKANKIFV